MYNRLCIIILYKKFFIGLYFKRDKITQKTHFRNIISANVLLIDIEGHTYIEKDGQIFIYHIFEINITNANNIPYYNINIVLQK